MNPALKARGASSLPAGIERVDGGGFVAIASDGDLDRDGERIRGAAFAPLPDSIPIHLDHTMSAASVVARGRPYYDLDRLMVEATFASTKDAQDVRQKVADGVIDSLSIVFLGKQWEDIDGVRTCVRGELLAADLVSIPSNARARVLSVRGLSPTQQARALCREVERDMVRMEIRSAKRLLAATDRRGPARRQVDDLLADTLSDRRPVATSVRNFLRSL